MEARGNRDKMVIATKYSGWNDGTEQDINSMGNHVKSMHLTVRDSLKRLRTSCECGVAWNIHFVANLRRRIACDL